MGLDCPEEKNSRVFRTHSASQAAKFRMNEADQEKKCFVISGVRDPHLSIPSRFFQSNKNRFCNGDLTKEEVIDEYDDWLRSSPTPRLQMSTTNDVVEAFGIHDFSHALNDMYVSGFALFKGPSDSASPWNGCELLLVQLDFEESSDNIAKGLSRLFHGDVKLESYPKTIDLCPDAANIDKALKEHELTDDLLNILAGDNPELLQGLNYYRRRSSKDSD